MTNEELEKIKEKVKEADRLNAILESFERLLGGINECNFFRVKSNAGSIKIEPDDLAYAQIIKILKEEKKRKETELEEL